MGRPDTEDLIAHPMPTALPTASSTRAPDVSIAASRGGGRAVLVVDSTPIARAFLMQRLRELGYDAHGADHGELALAMVEQQVFAIVFLELTLTPENGIDGLTLCQAIKQKPDHPRGIVPAVVITTSRNGSSDRVRGSLAGCDAYLTKPLAEAAFLVALREIDPLFQ